MKNSSPTPPLATPGRSRWPDPVESLICTCAHTRFAPAIFLNRRKTISFSNEREIGLQWCCSVWISCNSHQLGDNFSKSYGS